MKQDKILILGLHPILQDITSQYEQRGATVTLAERYSCETCELSDYTEIVILNAATEAASDAEADAQALALLNVVAADLTLKSSSGLEDKGGENGRHKAVTVQRPLTHVLLRCYSTLRMLLLTDLPAAVNKSLEVYPFTMEDTWAKNICVQLPGITIGNRDGALPYGPYEPLDRQPIDAQSQQTVHVVICGFGEQAQSVAINAALTCHYPNYREDDALPLRTRITIICDDISRQRDEFIAMYRHLFDNSYWRAIDIRRQAVDFHEPMYAGQRKDFVDVEWEFVDAAATDLYIAKRMEQWATDSGRQLTVVIAGDDDEANMSLALSMPPAVYERHIPVLVSQRSDAFASVLGESPKTGQPPRFGNVRLFGMIDCGYDVNVPLVVMAKYLKYFYDCSYGDIGVPTVLPKDEVDAAWQKEQQLDKRFSNIYNIMTVSTKMRSLGHANDDCDKFYALTQDEIKALARTEHNRWSVERLITGSRPCTDDEQRAIAANIQAISSLRAARKPKDEWPADLKKTYRDGQKHAHYDLRAYDELCIDATGKNAQTYDYDLTACIPLIVKTYCEDYGKKD